MNTLPLDIDRAKTKLKCPVCKKKKRLLDTDLIDVVAKASSNANIARSWIKDIQDFKWNDWGCKACVKSGKAAKADITKHTYIGPTERFFYIDRKRPCTNCKKEYTFTAVEQKFWYGVAKLPTDATAELCKKCRVDVPSKKEANKKLMALIPQLNPKDPVTIEKVGEMYRAIGSEEKAIDYLRKAKDTRPNK